MQQGDDKPLEKPVIRMHAEEADNFLNLAAALKVILARTVLVGDLSRAEFFLMKYLQTYLKVSLITSSG